MSTHTLNLTAALYDYLLQVSLREHPVLKKLREVTAELPLSIMQIAPEQGQFMQLLTKLIQAQRYLEVGVFTGYSTLSVALALPADGKIIACDVSDEWTSIAKQHWQEAQVAPKIDLRLAPALDTLKDLLNKGYANTFDMAFIDADKPNQKNYYEKVLQLLRPGGLVLIDNSLQDGQVCDPANNDAGVVAVRDLNQALLSDERIDLSLLPIADGLTLARKR